MALEPGRYYGQTAAPRAVAGFRISEVEYPPNLIIPRHDHELAGFCLVRAGAYDETYGRRRRACAAGTLVVHPAGEHHSDVHRDCVVRLLSVEVGAERHRQLSESIEPLAEPAHFEAGELTQMGQRLAAEMQRTDTASALAIEGLILEILALDARYRSSPRNHPPSWLRQADAFMRAHFDESLSVASIAKVAGVHPAHLARGFRQHYRCSVGDYLRGLRIEWAKAQLQDGELPLSEIAAMAGFADQSHFTRLFRNAVGVTPSRWRELNG
jgi:AraC family transcriptional regulator